ncbi:hypothetical protein [Halomonas dongshanensis]|uniref:Entry exclusion lipoprotein TrbK n=1 Tax=Halomonas dongshanensis TaxID=2890835 RepID=A0ABT2EJ11_9GAMM|nr:hypothetical protein [Halomonas dongshanensis]MCS2610579.1 hypothetical protein [Halomonas dongshanensis]
MILSRIFIVLLALLVLSGCASQTSWAPSGDTEEGLPTTQAECRELAFTNGDKQLYGECMRRKG